MDDTTLRALLARAGGGDSQAANQIYEATWRLVRAAARRRLQQLRAQGVPICEDNLDDAVQHVYAVLWSGVLWKPIQSSVSGFVFAVAWFRSGDYYTRKATAWLPGSDSSTAEDEDEPVDVPDPRPGPEELMVQQSELAQVQALARAHLTAREQVILELRVLQGLDPADIGTILHITAANVSATLTRIRQKLAPLVAGGAAPQEAP